MTTPTIRWTGNAVELIDQTRLPDELEILTVDTPAAMTDAIARLAVRGAPAIGVAGAYGVALAARLHPVETEQFDRAVAGLRSARPTAVNLGRMVDRAAAAARRKGPDAALEVAHAIRDEELAASRAMGELGADFVLELVGDRPVRVMTICNTGGLATVERGTALSVIQELFERDRLGEAIPIETRPLLQGARLTTWELQRMGAPFRLVVDSAGPFLLARDMADVVLIGADRVAANGDTANKIGSYSLALGAARASKPFIVVAPESTLDADTPDGSAIEIEDRGPSEVVSIGSTRITPAGTDAINPAFDVTPVDLITALVTDRRVVRFADGDRLAE